MLPSVGDASGREALLYTTLRDLLAIEATELRPALHEAAGLIAQVLNADTVDVFLYDASTDCLVAVCTPASPMGTRQRDSGLDRLPLASGGLVVKVFRSGGSYRTGQADQDPDERQDVVEVLEIRSVLLCRLQANGDARGVLQAASRQPNCFLEIDQLFLQAATRWMGL